jgi:hypothetical protein
MSELNSVFHIPGFEDSRPEVAQTAFQHDDRLDLHRSDLPLQPIATERSYNPEVVMTAEKEIAQYTAELMNLRQAYRNELELAA